ncbi:SPOR domain-containing protein [Ferrimonas futtsuensis]|uniref:SPOR domain-containing protein n=1 Tax=Ferrimonas futtsuensis TaxID=364764 RepID=UPI00042A1427|nr:AAA family ATPase [Ferrimonas futtsuensis]
MSDTAPSLLPSQQVLLERLKYLIEYGDHAILLHGKPGVGKSTLAQALLGTSEGFNQGMVLCPVQADPAQLRVDILHQLFTDPLFDPHEPLIDSFERLLKESEQRLLLVIDDAHCLPQVILAELLAMLLEQGERRWRLTLILVSQPKLVQHLLAELPTECQQHLLPITIDPLSLSEQKQLYRALTADRPLSRFINQLGIEPLLQKSDGSAQAVVDLVTGKGEETPAKAGLLRHRSLILALLGVVAALAVWIAVDPLGPELQQDAQGRSDSVRLVEVAPGLAGPESAQPEAVTETRPDSPRDNGDELGLAGEWQAINTPQPRPAPQPEDPLLRSAREGLVDLEQQLAAKQAVENPPQQPPEPQAEPAEPQPERKTRSAPEAKPLPLAEQPLMARPGDSYTLQLAVYSYPSLAAQYLKQLPLKQGLALYVNNRQPRPWHVVVYGGFESKAAAQAAVSSLPDAIRNNSPYVKPMQDVQKELVEQLDLAAFLSE